MSDENSDHLVMLGLMIIFFFMGAILFYIAFSTGGLGES